MTTGTELDLRMNKYIEVTEAVSLIADYFDLICDTDYSFDESELLRRLSKEAKTIKELEDE